MIYVLLSHLNKFAYLFTYLLTYLLTYLHPLRAPSLLCEYHFNVFSHFFAAPTSFSRETTWSHVCKSDPRAGPPANSGSILL